MREKGHLQTYASSPTDGDYLYDYLSIAERTEQLEDLCADNSDFYNKPYREVAYDIRAVVSLALFMSSNYNKSHKELVVKILNKMSLEMKNDIVAKFLINGGSHLLFSLFELDPMTSVLDALFSQVNYNSVRKLMIMAT